MKGIKSYPINRSMNTGYERCFDFEEMAELLGVNHAVDDADGHIFYMGDNPEYGIYMLYDTRIKAKQLVKGVVLKDEYTYNISSANPQYMYYVKNENGCMFGFGESSNNINNIHFQCGISLAENIAEGTMTHAYIFNDSSSYNTQIFYAGGEGTHQPSINRLNSENIVQLIDIVHPDGVVFKGIFLNIIGRNSKYAEVVTLNNETYVLSDVYTQTRAKMAIKAEEE